MVEKVYQGDDDLKVFFKDLKDTPEEFKGKCVRANLFAPKGGKKKKDIFFNTDNGVLHEEGGSFYILQNMASYKPCRNKLDYFHAVLVDKKTVMYIEVYEPVPEKPKKPAKPKFKEVEGGFVYEDAPETVYTKDHIKLTIDNKNIEVTEDVLGSLRSLAARWNNLKKKELL
ncbi:MAG: hypothetical protein HQK84_10105 [Nitrospinae bacterium]|nr:hypothetical protein [Nitrospinota bacterium]